jgi:precorrin-6B methylase 2
MRDPARLPRRWHRPSTGDTVLDIGANFGAFAVHRSRRVGHVHAFEPNPAAFARLLETFA